MGSFHQLSVFLRRWRLIAALAAVGAIVAFATQPSSKQDDSVAPTIRYDATHTLLKDSTTTTPARRGSTTDEVTDPDLENVAGLVTRGEVSELAAGILDDGSDPLELASTVRASTDAELGTIDIKATADDPDRAEEVADAFAQGLLNQLVVLDTERQNEALATAQARVDTLQSQIDDLDEILGTDRESTTSTALEAQREALVDRYTVAFDSLQDLQADPPSAGFTTLARATATPITPEEEGFSPSRNRLARTAIGLIAGLLLGALAAFVATRIDTRILTSEDAEAALGFPVIAEIPRLSRRFRGKHALPEDDPGFTEAFRMLRATLLVAGTAGVVRPVADDDPHVPSNGQHSRKLTTLLVTSASPSEGKTTVVAGLARALARARPTIAIDLDLRRPELHTFFHLPVAPGVTNVLALSATTAQDAPPAIGDVAVRTEPDLLVCPAGEPAAHIDLLPAGGALLQAARRAADIVLVDSPPALAVSDPSELVPAVDAVIVVCFAGRTTAQSAARLSELLARLGAPVAGAVLVGVKARRQPYPYYGSSRGADATPTASELVSEPASSG